jgi:hypothetical protein
MAKSGGLVNIAEKWVFCQFGKKMGFLLILQESGVFSIWQKSGVFVNMAKKWGFC